MKRKIKNKGYRLDGGGSLLGLSASTFNIGNPNKDLKSVDASSISTKKQNTLGALSGVAGGLASASGLFTGGNTSTAGNAIGSLGSAVSGINPFIGAGVQVLGNLVNAAFGSNVNEGAVSEAEGNIASIGQSLASASNYKDLLQAQKSSNLDVDNLDLGTQGWFSNAVDTERANLKEQLSQAQANFGNTASNLDEMERLQSMGNALANGGKIYIKPSKRGTFTAAAKKRGMGVQEFASKVLANKEDYSPAMVKKANFARNASKWHADGGMLFDDTFTNGVTEVNNGSTHEANPNGGVPMGVAPDGLNNLVEQGETIYKDYVFSDRLRVPKYIKEMYKLSDKVKTYSDAFKALEKESKERPNDVISNNGLNKIASDLMEAQEAQRIKEQDRKYPDGGPLGFINYIDKSTLFDPTFSQISDKIDLSYDSQLVPKTMKQTDLLGLGDYSMKEVTPSTSSTESSKDNSGLWGNILRFADPLANAVAVGLDAFGVTNKPTTYNYIPEYQSITPEYLGDYLTYTPLDINYAANRQAAQAAATRSALAQGNTPNKAALLLAQDYNALVALGDLYRNAQESNIEQRAKVAEFNRGTNQANAQMAMQAAQANAANRLSYANALLQQAQLNEASSNQASAARAANIGNLAESISNIGKESNAKSWRNMLLQSDVFGTLNEAMLSDPTFTKKFIEEYNKKHTKEDTKKAYGGRIKTKKKGLTY